MAAEQSLEAPASAGEFVPTAPDLPTPTRIGTDGPPPAPTPAAPPKGAKGGKAPPKGSDGQPLRDNFGRTFDPRLHEHDLVDGEAKPRLSKAGRLMFKRGNNRAAKAAAYVPPRPPPGAEAVGPESSEAPLDGAATPEPMGPDPFEVQAAGMVDTVAGLAAVTVSQDLALEPAERQATVQAVAAVYRKRGAVEVTPEAQLALLVVGIIGSRLSQPERHPDLATKWKRLKSWALPRLALLWYKVTGAPRPTPSPVDSSPEPSAPQA